MGRLQWILLIQLQNLSGSEEGFPLSCALIKPPVKIQQIVNKVN